MEKLQQAPWLTLKDQQLLKKFLNRSGIIPSQDSKLLLRA